MPRKPAPRTAGLARGHNYKSHRDALQVAIVLRSIPKEES